MDDYQSPGRTRTAVASSMILLFAALSVSAPARSAPPAAVLTASDGWAGMLFGGDIAGSGDIVVIGAASPDAAAYVFRRPVGGWSGSLVEVAKLVPSDPIASQYLGHRVAIDGDTIVVSAAGPTFGPTARPGAAYVYVRPAGGWAGTLTETAKLVASDGSAGDQLGTAVAIAGDLVLVGAAFDSIGVNMGQGSAYVFRRPAGGWNGTLTQAAKLVSSDGAASDLFGGSVAIAGTSLVVGAHYADVDGNLNQGAAYVYNLPAGGWAGTLTEDAKFDAGSTGTLNDNFATRLVASGDLIIASDCKGISPNLTGAGAYVFLRPAGGWSGDVIPDARLFASDEGPDRFGCSLALSGGGEVLVGSAMADVDGLVDRGAVYRYRQPAGGWSGWISEIDKIVADDAVANDKIGAAVGWSGDQPLVGSAHADRGGNIDEGRVLVFDAEPPRTLTVQVDGDGSVVSLPAGIDCPATCGAAFADGTAVVLTATPSPITRFAGWSGDADCSDGTVTLDADRTCIATFTPLVMLGVGITVEGQGRVTSHPAGIDCSFQCVDFFAQGTVLTLTATPDPGWQFDGWSGSADCSDGQITVNDDIGCTATFSAMPVYGVDITVEGQGRVTSLPAGIDCTGHCVEFFDGGTMLTLAATPDPGWQFDGWSGSADCSDGQITVNDDIGCTATFSEIPQLPDLHGEWLRVRRLCLPWGQQPLCFLFGRFGLRNSSPVDAGASTVRYYLSADEVVDGGDRAIGSRNVGVMPPGGPRPLAMGVLLRGMTPRGLYVIAVVDADGAVDERDETNNAIVFGPIP